MASEHSSESLKHEIKFLESQISYRRRNLKSTSLKFVKEFKNRISSPNAMWAAGSVGFIIGELTRRPKIQVSEQKMPMYGANINNSSRTFPKDNISTPFQDLSRFVAVSFSLLNSWPASVLMSYFLQNNHSQKKNQQIV
jgi:hypothetical protein